MKQYTSNIKKVSLSWDFKEAGGRESLWEAGNGLVRAPRGWKGWAGLQVMLVAGGLRRRGLRALACPPPPPSGLSGKGERCSQAGQQPPAAPGPAGPCWVKALLSWRGISGGLSGPRRWEVRFVFLGVFLSFWFSCCCSSLWQLGCETYQYIWD